MTTVSVDAFREQLLKRLQNGQTDDFLTLAAHYLTACPDDHYTRLMAIREYLELGLVRPARDLLDDTAPTDLPPELRTVRHSIDTLPDDVIPWSTRKAIFEVNLRTLATRGIDADAVLRAWHDAADRFQLFRDQRGLDQIRMCDTQGNWKWVPRLGHHKRIDDQRPLPNDVNTPMPGPYLFEGLDLGFYFRRLYDATRNTFLGYSCALFVVEPDPATFAVTLHLHDWRDVFADPRVLFFLGQDATDRLRRAWDDNLDLPFPSQAFNSDAMRDGVSVGAVNVVQKAIRKRQSEIAQSREDLDRRYADRDLHYWAQRFDAALSRRERPLRILAAVSTHTTFLQYSMRDAKRAFESLGHECRVLTEKTDHTLVGPLTYHNAIREFEPDLFLSIDHLRPEFAALIPANLPVLTWDQDQLPHVFTDANIRATGPLDFIAGYAKARCIAAGCDPARLLNARVPTCPQQFAGEPLTDDERARYTCDVSYVSHGAQPPRQFHDEERARHREQQLQQLLDQLYDLAGPAINTHTVMSGLLSEQLLTEACARCGIRIQSQDLRERLLRWYLWRLGDRLFRHQTLEWVADWARRTGHTFRIYGNGWEKHPTLAPFAAGPAQNGRELICVYRASRINLQLMPAGFVHQRALDGLAAGGFFLSRATPDDLRGHTLRRLTARIDELGIESTHELLRSDDPALRDLLRAYRGDWIHRIDPDEHDLLQHIRLAAELIHPEEAFPHFRDILFDSPESFAQKAEHYLAHPRDRRDLTQQMRTGVIKHFSYEPAMQGFLTAMTNYFRAAAQTTQPSPKQRR